MSLTVKDVALIIEDFAPIRFKESYDNVGLMVGNSSDNVGSILVALDCTLDVISEAKDVGCNLIITHHPLLFKKPSSITTDTLQGRKIIELVKSNINLYSCHTNLDSVRGGINDLVVQILGFESGDVIKAQQDRCENECSGIGRIVVSEEGLSLGELCDKVKIALGIEHIRYSGDLNKLVKKIAVINGSGQDYFYEAVNSGADCIISGDTTYHYVSDYLENGVAILDAGHFATEWPAMKLFAQILESKLQERGFCNSVFVSKKTEDPYKFK